MKIARQLSILSFLLLFALSSCQKDDETTDQKSTEQSTQNEVEEDSQTQQDCTFHNDHLLGTYSVNDSTSDPFGWYYDSYGIRIQRCECDSNTIVIRNYANLTNSTTSPIDTFDVIANVNGNIITVPDQVIGYAPAIADSIAIYNSTGYFSADSIYLDFDYNTYFDPYFGKLWGKKD